MRVSYWDANLISHPVTNQFSYTYTTSKGTQSHTKIYLPSYLSLFKSTYVTNLPVSPMYSSMSIYLSYVSISPIYVSNLTYLTAYLSNLPTYLYHLSISISLFLCSDQVPKAQRIMFLS